jgi:hypothetical protein
VIYHSKLICSEMLHWSSIMEWVLSDSMRVRLIAPKGEVVTECWVSMDTESCDLYCSVYMRVVKSRRMRHGKVCITHGEVKESVHYVWKLGEI